MSKHDYALQILIDKRTGLEKQIKKDKEFIITTKLDGFKPILKCSIAEASSNLRSLNETISLLQEENH